MPSPVFTTATRTHADHPRSASRSQRRSAASRTCGRDSSAGPACRGLSRRRSPRRSASRVALRTAVRAVVLVAVNAPEVRGHVGVAAEAVAPATVRSEQHHADTTSANADRGAVATTGLILARARRASGAPRGVKRRNWVAGESQPTNLARSETGRAVGGPTRI